MIHGPVDASAGRASSGRKTALHGERGSTIVLVSFAIAGLLGMVALAVDIGMLFTARSEAQRAADSAALAGASGLIEAPPEVVGDDVAEEHAKDIAIDYAAQNTVRDEFAEIERGDVEVDLPRDRVTVTVRRISERGNPVGTWFARIFGVDEVDVAARATAEVVLANAGTCMKPFTIPDAWDDDGDGEYEPGENYVANETGYGSDFRNGVPADNGVDPAGTTYDYDFGRPIVIREGQPQETITAGWYYPWDVPQANGPSTGADRFEWNIANCNTSVVVLGEEYDVENGRMRQKTLKGVKALIDKDAGAYWDLEGDSVAGSRDADGNPQPWKASERIVNIPLFDPMVNEVEPGKKPLVFNNITAFFIVGLDEDEDVIGRFLYASGIGIAGDGPEGDGSGNQAKRVRLVE